MSAGYVKVAPMVASLWTLTTMALLRALAQETSTHWVQDEVTMFADDLLLQWTFQSVPELDRMMVHVGVCMGLSILHKLGLEVQHKKTSVMIAHRGRLARQWWQRHTVSTYLRERERERARERERESEREREREGGREGYSEIEKERARERENKKQKERERERDAHTHTHTHTHIRRLGCS